MNPDRLVAGLDIGSAKTSAIIAEVTGDLPKHPGVKVLGVGQAPTTGLRKGVVSDIEETTRSIRKAVQDAERMAGAEVEFVYAAIAGEHVQTMTSRGIVAVSGDEIRKTDVDRATDVARTQAMPADRELVHDIPQEFTVDRNAGVRDPIGMSGLRLETEMFLVTVGKSPAENLRRAVQKAGYSVKGLVVKPIASALATLTEDEKELGVSVVELGAGATDVAIFHDGKIRYLSQVPYGGNRVTNDLVHGLALTHTDAERFKLKHGAATTRLVQPKDMLRLPSTEAQGDREIERELLVHIIHHRLDEILGVVQDSIAAAGYEGRLAGGIVLTGGAAVMPGIVDLARDVFGTGVRIGVPGQGLAGLNDSVEAPRFATVVGLAIHGANQMAFGGGSARRHSKGSGSPVDDFGRRVKSWLEDFF